MTIFAGVLSRGTQPRTLPPHVVESLRLRLSRRNDAEPQLLTGDFHAFVCADFGLFEGGAVASDNEGPISLLAGDPLIERDGLAVSRPDALRELHAQWRTAATRSLRDARGSFCGVHYDPRERRLWLITDKLGLRPIFYAVLDEYVMFATSLRVLAENPLISRQGDIQGLAETACFGYPLGPRTALKAVRSLEAAEIVAVTPQTSKSITYWRWDDLPTIAASEHDMCGEIKRGFISALRLRLGNRRRAVLLLSSGLDSRCVAGCLRAEGVEVDTIGCGREGSAELVLGRQVAMALGTRHFEFGRSEAEFGAQLAAAYAAWRAGPGRNWPGDTVQRLWTGEGGDRVLAPVNLYEDVIEAMRDGDIDAAIACYMRAECTGLPRRMFRSKVQDTVRRLPAQGLRAELERYHNEDAGRRFHLYVLLTEARRNVEQDFENLDTRRVEPTMPFYDSELVRIVLQYPLDPFVRHRLYHQWLTQLPDVITRVPWQEYPGAKPCPLPMPRELATQWEDELSDDEERDIRRATIALANELIANANFPHWLLRRPVLRVARMLSRLGMTRFRYLFDVARPFVLHPPSEPIRPSLSRAFRIQT